MAGLPVISEPLAMAPGQNQAGRLFQSPRAQPLDETRDRRVDRRHLPLIKILGVGLLEGIVRRVVEMRIIEVEPEEERRAPPPGVEKFQPPPDHIARAPLLRPAENQLDEPLDRIVVEVEPTGQAAVMIESEGADHRAGPVAAAFQELAHERHAGREVRGQVVTHAVAPG